MRADYISKSLLWTNKFAKIFPGLMPFCGEAAKRHYKGLTIDEILRMVYNRLKLHVGSNIDLA